MQITELFPWDTGRYEPEGQNWGRIEVSGYNERMLLFGYSENRCVSAACRGRVRTSPKQRATDAFRQLLKDYIHIGSGEMRVVGEVQTWDQDSCQPCQPKPTTKKTARVTTRVGCMSRMAVPMASQADSENVSRVHNVHTIVIPVIVGHWLLREPKTACWVVSTKLFSLHMIFGS